MNNRFFNSAYTRIATPDNNPSASQYSDLSNMPMSYWLLLANAFVVLTTLWTYLYIKLTQERRKENFSRALAKQQDDAVNNNKYEDIINEAKQIGHHIKIEDDFIDFYFRTIIQHPVYFIDENNTRTTETCVDRSTAMIIMQMTPKVCPLTRKKIIGFKTDHNLDGRIKAFIQSVEDELNKAKDETHLPVKHYA